MAGWPRDECYFGNKCDQDGLVREDWRSRDQRWDYCRIAVNFFCDHLIRCWNMGNTDESLGEPQSGVSKFFFSMPGRPVSGLSCNRRNHQTRFPRHD